MCGIRVSVVVIPPQHSPFHYLVKMCISHMVGHVHIRSPADQMTSRVELIQMPDQIVHRSTAIAILIVGIN